MKLFNADCLTILPTLPECSVDSLVTDPPAGIGFMGKEWDDFRRSRGRDQFIEFLSTVAQECLRILKPGSYGLVWAIPRTSHWTATALEDGGFEIRDRIAHIFGTGFPKAKSCLKPACEDWWLIRKPAKRVEPLPGLDACRIPHVTVNGGNLADNPHLRSHINGGNGGHIISHEENRRVVIPDRQGRWPANLTLDEEAAAMLDEQTGEVSGGDKRGSGHGQRPSGFANVGSENRTSEPCGPLYADRGGPSRFFYVAKASKLDRGEGNTHPTVKSTALMTWLIRLVTPLGGIVLDPFMGSGSTLVAAKRAGFDAIGIEREEPYFKIAENRIRGIPA